jgi:uncharacterized protein YbbK (DUF523 family)
MIDPPFLVSACLIGIPCRFDGKSCRRPRIQALLKNHGLIFACPEQLGGLPTPRAKSRRRGRRVLTALGRDVTAEFDRGAKAFIRIARQFKIRRAYLKSRSPSCGERGIVRELLPRKIKVEYIE